jgi:tape measure domain-containing protein
MVGKDKIEITAELKDLLTGQLKNIQNEAAKLDNTLKNLGDGGAIGGKAANTQRSMMGSVLGANLLTQGIGMATGAIKDFAASSVDAYMKNEMYEARLTTLLHGREQALSALSQITKDAALTPFDKQSLVQGNSMLIGAGESASGARKSIMDLGNAIAATGGGSDELSRMSVNLAQIKSIGKASALDVKQFMYANIPIYDMLSKSMGKNIKEIKEMDISYKDLTKALSDARQEGGMFYQGLENANQTLSGQVSNLGDSWEQLKVSMAGSQSGILKNTVSWVNSMVSAINVGVTSINTTQNRLAKGGSKSEFSPTGLKDIFDPVKLRRNYELAGTSNALNANVDVAGRSLQDAQNQKIALLSNMFKYNKLHESGVNKDSQSLFMDKMAIMTGALSEMDGIIKGFKDAKTDGSGKDGKGSAESKVSSLEKVAAANRPTQVNVNIENLVREYSNTFNTAAEALKMTPEQVAKVLIGAVNDISNLKYT